MLRGALFLFLVMLSLPVQAADWIVDRVRGAAQVQSGGGWTDLGVGMVIASGDRLRTGPNGRATLARGDETIELAVGTEIQLFDEGAQLTTALKQSTGTVTVDVERRNVQHFSVQTAYMAAVVKGTRFVVTVGPLGAEVAVERGEVQVQDRGHDRLVDIRPGQTATVSPTSPMAVDGPGTVVFATMDGSPVQPSQTTADGSSTSVDDDATQEPSDAKGNAGDEDSSEASDNNGNFASNGSSNAGGNGNGNSANNGNSNAGGNGNGNSANNGSSNAGGNGNGNSASNGNSNAGGNGNGSSASSNAGGNGKSNAGGNGKGKGNDDDGYDDE